MNDMAEMLRELYEDEVERHAMAAGTIGVLRLLLNREAEGDESSVDVCERLRQQLAAHDLQLKEWRRCKAEFRAESIRGGQR